jgi:hypothetical protein
MAQVDFQKIFDQLRDEVGELAKKILKEYANEARRDAFQILDSTKVKLRNWAQLVADKQLSVEDFEWLLTSQKDLAQMHALKQAGIAKIRIDQFKDGVFKLIADTILGMVM